MSAARWIAARLLFAESGINIDTDLRGYSNGGCCEDVAFTVYLKAVEAGVVCDHFLKEHSKKQQELGVEAEEIVVIGRTQPVPTKVFTAARKVDPEIIDRVNKALLTLDVNLPSHEKILSQAELGGFQKAEEQEFDDIKRLFNSVAGE